MPLHAFLAFLLIVTLLVTLGTVGSAILAVRLPQIMQENHQAVQSEAEDLVSRMEFLMNNLQVRLEPLESLLGELLPRQLHSVLDAIANDESSFSAIYVLSPGGIVEAVGIRSTLYQQHASHQKHADLIGSDLSANRLFRMVQAK